MFSKDTELHKQVTAPIIPIEEIKFYPGSSKGKEPEDDPEAYTKWYIENQPESLGPV